MKQRGVVTLVALGLLSLLGAWLLTAREAPRTAGEPATPHEVSEEAVPREPAVVDRASVVAPTLAEKKVETDPASSSQVPPRPPQQVEPVGVATQPLVTLNGTATRFDEGGLEYPGEDGSFLLSIRRAGRAERIQVEVLGGSWSCEIPAGELLHVRELVLGGTPITLEPDEFLLPEQRFLELKGLGLRAVRLHVRSREDQRELRGIEVWPGPKAFPTALRHPGAEPEGTPLLRDASSPLTIPATKNAWRAARQIFVRAPGHAWGSIDLDHKSGGERTLLLEPAAALEVELLGSADWLDPTIRLWPPDASRYAAYPHAERKTDDEHRAVFRALPPGTYFASVERGWADRRVSFGNATIDLVAGEAQVLQIAVQLPEKPEPVQVSGTLVVPFGWLDQPRALTFAGAGATEMWLDETDLPFASLARQSAAPEGCEQLAFEITLPRRGSYGVEVKELYRTLLVVPASGLDDLHIVLPPPAFVEVAVIDVATEQEIQVESLRWSLPRIEGIVATYSYTAVHDPALGRVTFRAPAQDIRLSQTSQALLAVDEERSYPLQPGGNELELRVQRLSGVRFTFRDGEASIPWNWSWRLSAHRADGARDRARSIGMLWFIEGGTYELRTQGIPGYRSIDGTQIDVPDVPDVIGGNAIHEVEIELTRETTR